MSRRVAIFGIEIDALDRGQVLRRLVSWLDEEATGRFVVTPNVDHVVKLSQDAAFRAAYRAAGLVVVDGTPVLWAARWLGRPLPGLVTGSDLTPALFEATRERGTLRVFLFGAADGVADEAARRIRARWPHVDVCGVCSPPRGFEQDESLCLRLAQDIRDARPEVLVLGLGAPKQELWAQRISLVNPAKVTLCVGATIDFLAGHVHRAPAWLRGTGFEWLHRVMMEPRRLWRRYASDAIRFPVLVWREWRNPSP